ncbi:MAG: tetratricopeptide repeat protein, partial [Acidobacteriota bacterium]
RRTLGEGAKDHRFIVTIPGRGYRFVAPVTTIPMSDEPERIESDTTDEDHASLATLAIAIPIRAALAAVALLVIVMAVLIVVRDRPVVTTPAPRVLAVLPFEALGTSNDILGVGLADAVINRLSRLPALTVRPTSAVLRWRDNVSDPVAIGRTLQVGAVLTGTVQSTAERVRVTTQLTQIDTPHLLWTGTFDQQGDDPFELQDTLSAELARALAVELGALPAAPATSRDARAYRAYLEGRLALSRRTRESLDQAIEAFGRAIEHDPDYALPYQGLADAYYLQTFYDSAGVPPREHYLRVRENAQKALERDPSLGAAHSTLGVVAYNLDHDFATAETHFQRALELDPGAPRVHHRYGWFLLAMDRPEASRAALERARELDPLSLIRTTALAMHGYFTGDLERALAILEDAQRIDPDFSRLQIDLGLVHEALGNVDQARIHFDKARQQSGDSSESLAAAGYLAGKAGDLETWRDVQDALRQRARRGYVSPLHFALLASAVNDQEEALRLLQEAIEERSVWPVALRWDPRLEGLRVSPSFLEPPL